MFGSAGGSWIPRSILISAAVVGTILVVAGLGGCGALLVPRQPSAATPVATPAPSPTPVATPTPVPLVPLVIPTPTPTPVTPTEAQSVVAAWFDAVIAQDYQTASDLTVGVAFDRTRQLSEGFARATGGNRVNLQKQRLDLNTGYPQDDGSQQVMAAFDIQVNAQVGPISVGVQHLVGNATFIVQRVDGRTRITDVRDVSGLPAASQ